MSFGTPAMLAALVLLLPVLLSYLVKQNTRLVRVPSSVLWRRGAIGRAKSRKFRDLMRLASLLACMAAVAALVAAAARPARSARGETVALVVDVSASMEAGGARAPLGRARRALERLLRGRGQGDRYAIVAAGASPRVLVGPTESTERLMAATAALAAEPRQADLGAALRLAAALVEHEPGPRVLVLTDGVERAGDLEEELGKVPAAQVYLPAPGADNVGITAFSLHTLRGASDAGAREARVTVATSSSKERRVRVVLTADGREIARRGGAVRPAGEAEFRMQIDARAGLVSARVVAEDGVADALPGDDQVTVKDVVAPPPRVVLLTSSRAEDDSAVFFVQQAIAASAPGSLAVRAASDATPMPPADVAVVLDRSPPTPLDVPTLYVATTHGGSRPFGGMRWLWRKDGGTRLRSVEAGDPLLDGVVLDELTISRAAMVTPPPGARSLVDLDGGPVLLQGGAGSRAWVYLGIEPLQSDLVLRVAFPVLVANALAQLSGARAVVSAEAVPRSEVALVSAPLPWLDQVSEPGFHLSIPPSGWLAALAFALLAAEAWAFRKGWV